MMSGPDDFDPYDPRHSMHPKGCSWVAWVFLSILGALCVLAFFAATARAHEAPTGWKFDPACCGGNDCKPVAYGDIVETPNGYYIPASKETIPYQSTKVRASPDGFFYRCSVGGKPEAHTYCIYVNKGGV